MGAVPEPVSGRVAIVGPCGAGKSELVRRLRSLGYDARQCGQEHSLVPDMWRQISRPQVLVYLDAPGEVLAARRGVEFEAAYLSEQRRRLAHALAHSQVCVQTGDLDRQGVAEMVRRALVALGLTPQSDSAPLRPLDEHGESLT